MPITEELKNIKKFEAVGFTHEQAEVLAEIQEDSIQSGIESLKEFIHNEIKDLRNIDIANIYKLIETENDKLHNEIKALDTKLDSELKLVRMELRMEFKADIIGLKADIEKSLKDLLIKIFAIVFGISGVLFTVLKLFG